MRIRDAVESDAETLATAIDRPQGAVIGMIHDRSVRVAVSDDGRDGGSGDGDDRESRSDTETVNGFIAFDVHNGAVHVTDFDGQVTDFEGDNGLVQRLFEEPRRFASREGLAVEVVVPDDEGSSAVIEEIGFRSVGPGPRFEGRATTRYRINSDEID